MRSSELQELATHAGARAGIAGLALAAVTTEGAVYLRGHGLACIETGDLVDEHTPFLLASVSKLFVAAVLLALDERQMLDLDSDVSRWLPFQLRHPAHPKVPISVRMLLAHRAAIADDIAAMLGAYSDGDSPIPLEGWLAERLGVDRDLRARRGFASEAPGQRTRYSNTGYALAALAAERAAAMPFADLARALVFTPLGMHDSGFRLREVRAPARPYAGEPPSPPMPIPHPGFPDYPSGTLRSSAADLALFVTAILRGGAPILSSHSVGMMVPTAEQPGLGWQRFDGADGTLVGIDGADRGAGTRVRLDQTRGVASIILGNSCWTAPPTRARELETLDQRLRAWAAQAKLSMGGGVR